MLAIDSTGSGDSTGDVVPPTIGVPPDLVVDGHGILTGVPAQELPRHVLLIVRDALGFDKPAIDVVSAQLQNVSLVADTDMFETRVGSYGGLPVTVCAMGSGSPEVEIAITELSVFARCDTFVRVGTAGGYQSETRPGDLLIAEGAVRDEGTTAQYVAPGFPAIADRNVVGALVAAAEQRGARYHVGILRSTDSLFNGQGRPLAAYRQPEHLTSPGYWQRAGVLAVDRETSCILTIGRLLGLRCGSICAVANNAVSGALSPGAGVESGIVVALEAMRQLAM